MTAETAERVERAERYEVRLGCPACGAINVHGGIPVESHWFDHFDAYGGVECDNCRCQSPVALATLWCTNLRNKTGPFSEDEMADIRRDIQRPKRRLRKSVR